MMDSNGEEPRAGVVAGVEAPVVERVVTLGGTSRNRISDPGNAPREGTRRSSQVCGKAGRKNVRGFWLGAGPRRLLRRAVVARMPGDVCDSMTGEVSSTS